MKLQLSVKKASAETVGYFTKLRTKFAPEKPRIMSEEEIGLRQQFEELRRELQQKEQNFLLAEEVYIDIAISDWEITKKRINTVLLKIKDIMKSEGVALSEESKGDSMAPLNFKKSLEI